MSLLAVSVVIALIAFPTIVCREHTVQISRDARGKKSS